MRYEYPAARMRYRGATERLYMNRPNLIRLIKSPKEKFNNMFSPAPPQHPTHTDIHHRHLPRV